MRHRGKSKIIIGVIIAVAAIVAFALVMHGIESVQNRRGDGDSSDTDTITINLNGTKYVTDHHLKNYLIIGTDHSNTKKNSEEGYHGGMADFLLLVVLDETDQTYGYLQINRDTMTDVDMLDQDGDVEMTDTMQICMAHWYGTDETQSSENTVTAVSGLLGGYPIDGYYTMDMDDVGKLNHAVGGVTVTIPQDMTQVDPAFTDGATLRLSDSQAEAFLRARMEQDKSFVTDLYDRLKQVTVTDLDSGAANRIANQLYKSKKANGTDDAGIITPKGKTTEGKTDETRETGELYTEFHPDTSSLVSVMEHLASIKEK